MSLLTDPAFPLFVICCGGALFSTFMLGKLTGSPVYTATVMPAMAESPAIPQPSELVAAEEMRHTLAPLAADPADIPNPYLEIEVVHPTDPVEADAAQALLDEVVALSQENVELRGRVEWLQRTKKAALSRVAIERTRVRVILTDLWTRPRKPRQAQLATEVIEVGDRTAPLVPPAIVKEWTS